MANIEPEKATNVLNDGRNLAPGVSRFLYGGYLVLAMAAIVLSWRRSTGALVPVALVIVGLTVVISILMNALARLDRVTARATQGFLLLFTIAIVVLFITSVFFGFPERGAIIVARAIGLNQLAISHNDSAPVIVDPTNDALPDWTIERPHTDQDRFELIAALSRRAPVIIKGTTISVKEGTLYFNVLTLDDAAIITEGGDVTIEAVRVESTGSSGIRALPTGHQSMTGNSGGRVTLVIYDQMDGHLTVDLRGSQGAAGAAGTRGPDGPSGPPGENSAQGLFGCKHGGGTGGRGGAGGPGEDGGPGLPGGDGGTLVIKATQPNDILRSVDFIANGGPGGSGGLGGDGGTGGRGGPGGHGGGFCGGGQAGPDGPNGQTGRVGPAGTAGRDGKIVKLGFET